MSLIAVGNWILNVKIQCCSENSWCVHDVSLLMFKNSVYGFVLK